MKNNKYIKFCIKISTFCCIVAFALASTNCLIGQTNPSNSTTNSTYHEKFGQLGTVLPTPNSYRTASGAPGGEYWQQKADYDIQVILDDKLRRIEGRETITYFNQSPDVLTYLWLQLDQNIYAKDADSRVAESKDIDPSMHIWQLESMMAERNFDGAYHIHYVRDKNGKGLPYTINKTMMRVDLPQPLKPGESYALSIEWDYFVNECRTLGGRGGYEYFKEDNNNLYEIAHWFPRMAVYDDVNGWQHKQFLGRGEFALAFGDYKVSINAPADFVVGATGTLQNPTKVLTSAQIERFKNAEQATVNPILIITPDEALQNEKSQANETKTWVFQAKNVRDFAWASSRKFIWDAMAVKVGNNNVMCMSYYPKEGNPLWEKYSTHSVAHAIRVYSKYTVDYPYPVAISVNGPVGGMEYPMICFNGPRPEKDGTYSEGTKNGLISVVIHEVGHNFFPMIINSDERQWTWMDEGLNSFTQYLCEQEWSRDYPSRRGPARNIVNYMKGDKAGIEPIMTNSESITQFGNNAYGKPATALNILRETIMGRELFDYAYKEYARRWAFKHPAPADFFRTMEDASGVDLDWFWRGWFYGIDPVDVAIKDVKYYEIDTKNPEIEAKRKITERENEPKTIDAIRNRETIAQTLNEQNPSINDFYNSYDPLKPTAYDQKNYQAYLATLSDEDKKMLSEGYKFYQIDFENIGGLLTPLIVELTFTNGQKELHRIPAEIWRKNDKMVSKIFIVKNELASVALDPLLETADIDVDNNYFPPKLMPSRFEVFKERENKNPRTNPMQIQKKLEKR